MIGSRPDLPEEILVKAKELFADRAIQDALKLLALSKVSISFSKGSIESYFIVSGIVKQDRSHECKAVYKKRLEGSEEGPLSTNCDCYEWRSNKHCSHTCALFIYFLLSQNIDHSDENQSDILPPVNLGASLGVNVGEYGTILKGPFELIGAPASATYSSVQYLLHTKKVVNFPIPENFDGKLLIDITSVEKFREEHGESDLIPQIRFSHRNTEDKLNNKISLFENLYLFDWEKGEAYHLPSDLKSLIQKIRIYNKYLSVNDVLKLCTADHLDKYCEIKLDGTPLNEVKEVPVNCRLTLSPGERKTQLEFKIQFYDDQEKITAPPEFLTAFTFGGGLLGSFKKKTSAYEFVASYAESIEYDTQHYKKELINSSQRDKWLELTNFIKTNEKSYVYDFRNKEICIYDNHFLLQLIHQMHKCFGDLMFRYGVYNDILNEINFQVPSANLFSGLSLFHQKMSPYGISLFYDRNEIARWNSRIRFERRATTTKWFDLELNVSQEDLAIIKQADLNTGLALTSNGLVLLEKEQKDLLKFMKKYTQYEGKEDEDDNLEKEFKTFVLPFNRSRIFELFELRKLGVDGALTQEEIELCDRLSNLQEVPEYPIPESLDGVLRPYQKVGYNWLRFLYENKLGACLADDMGLGKTLQTISFIHSIYDQIDRVLIVCPVSILLNWEKEIEKFSNMDICIYHGGERKFPTDQKIILTSYGVMKREIDETFATKEFDVLILDEVQHLKNIRSLGAYAARKINAQFRICLTGTPVENDLSEFYNILDLSIPGVWGDLQFIRTTSTKKSRLIARKTASPFILRRTKKQVLTDLPPKVENNVYLSLSDQEKEFYKNQLSNIRNRINNSPSKKKYGEILKGLLQLRQNCLWQTPTPGAVLNINQVESTKVDFLVETLEQIIEEGHQAIIFSQFTTYLDIIQKRLEKKLWKLSRIDGSQTIKKRQQQVDIFQSGNSQVFLISLKAGGVGLNLTAASYVFIMDPWWNPAVEAQAIDRAHRIGQKNNLTVYRPIIKDSVEEKVLKLQEMKRELFQELLPEDEEDLFTGKLSMKDFESLFE